MISSTVLHRVIGPARSVKRGGETDLNFGSHGISPYDFAAIYNVIPLWNSWF